MLNTLRIRHFAVIDALESHFEPGFNVISGETGAGKSILIDALSLLAGGRARAELVRTGFDECSVEGLFEPLDARAVDARLESAGLPACEEGQLVLRRTVHREGRSRAFVNGSPATLGQLSQVARGLVDISSQHEHASLLDESRHLHLLDAFAGLEPQLAHYRAAWEAFAEAGRRLASLSMDEAERARRLDYARFQLEEIERIDPQPGEDESLAAERKRLAASGRLREAAVGAESLLYSSENAVVDRLSEAVASLERVAETDAALKPLTETLRDCLTRVSDTARELGRYGRGIHDDPGRLDEVDERIEALRRLARKHGGTLESVLRRREEMQREVEQLGAREEHLARAAGERAEKLAQARKLADALTQARRAAAGEFARAVVGRLADLEMKKTVFEVRVGTLDADADGAIEADGTRLTSRGQDDVRFLLSPNPGEEPRPLARVASGGELSRVMLAIKRVLAERDPVETYVFDEVDAGIGGSTGEVVGRLIREVGRERQVLCITHLAQIAAWGETHFTVEKAVRDGRTHSSLARLDPVEGRQREVARMLSGHITAASLEHARELLERGAAPAKKARRPARAG